MAGRYSGDLTCHHTDPERDRDPLVITLSALDCRCSRNGANCGDQLKRQSRLHAAVHFKNC